MMNDPTVEFSTTEALYKLFTGLHSLDNSVYSGIPLLFVALYFTIRSITNKHGLLGFRERAGRKEYIIKYIGTFIAVIFFSLVATIFLYEKHYIYSAVCLYIMLFFYVYNCSITIKRLHDLNISGWAIIPLLIVENLLGEPANEWVSLPLVISVLISLFLAYKKGTIGANKYGDEPNLGAEATNMLPCEASDTTAKVCSIKGLLFLNGRRSRFPYFLVMIAVDIAYFYAEYIQKDSNLAIYSYIFALLYYISFCNTGKRLQDLNASPMLGIAYIFITKFLRIDELIGANIPVSATFELIVSIILTFQAGTKGPNKYGPDPSDS